MASVTATPVLSDDEIRKIAKARTGFKIHLVIYVIVNAFLAGIYFVTRAGFGGATFEPGADFYWPIWPLMGWGVGLAIHGFVVYAGGLNWERQEEQRLRAKYGRSP